VYGSWVVEGLQEGVGYMARVQAKNRYGWSDHSQTFYFFAEPHEDEPEPSKQSYTDLLNKNLQLASSAVSLDRLGVIISLLQILTLT